MGKKDKRLKMLEGKPKKKCCDKPPRKRCKRCPKNYR